MVDLDMARRLAGLLNARMPELGLGAVRDGRRRRGKRWKLKSVLASTIVGAGAGCRSLAELELMTAQLSPAARQLLGVDRRLPDTTARTALNKQCPFEVRRLLHRQTKKAKLRKALRRVGLPFGVLAMDGKSVTLKSWDERFAQQHTTEGGLGSVGLLRTVSCCLVSSRVPFCIDAIPIPAETNEMGFFRAALESLMKTYGRTRLFQLITYDAGACSEQNAQDVVDWGKDYLFNLKDARRFIVQMAESLLGPKTAAQAQAWTETVLSNRRVVIRRVWTRALPEGIRDFPHARSLVRVQSQTLVDGKLETEEDRYFMSSLAPERLKPEQWLRVVRYHWRVENDIHKVADVAFGEDDHPWIQTEPQGALVVLLLRRVAQNLLALFRGLTLRSEESRTMRWAELMQRLRDALVALSWADVDDLRERKEVAGFT